MFRFIKSDIEKMTKRGVISPILASDLDNYEGEGLYFNHIKTRLIKETKSNYLATFGEPASDDVIENVLKNDPMTINLFLGANAEYLAAINFDKHDKKVFYFSDSLIERLAQTELDAPADYVRLPFPSCMFVIQSPIAINNLYKIGDHEPPSYSAPLTIFLSEHDFCGLRKIMIQVFHADEYTLYDLVQRELLIHPQWRISQSLCTDWLDLYRQNPDWLPGDKTSPNINDDNVFYEEGLQFFKIIINSVLYLASNDPDIMQQKSPNDALRAKAAATLNGYKRYDLEREASQYSELSGFLLGVNVPPIIINKSAKQNYMPQLEGSTTIDKRFLVRGHWKKQAHGQNMLLRKLIWIQPYWKGPEMADLINKSYSVK